jgi:hypothetical protein
MNLPKAYRSFNDLYNRIIVEADGDTAEGESAIGNAFKSFGQSYADSMRDAYNITANKIGLGIKKPEDKAKLDQYQTLVAQYGLKPDSMQVLQKIETRYSTDALIISYLKIKPLKLKAGESVIFNINDWTSKKKLTPTTVTVNKNAVYLSNANTYKQFYTSFLGADMNRPTLDPEFLKVLDDSVDEFLKEKYITSTPAPSAAGSPPPPPPTITPEIQSKINAETPVLKKTMLDFFKILKKPSTKSTTITSPSLYFKVFYTFTSNPKGSLLF